MNSLHGYRGSAGRNLQGNSTGNFSGDVIPKGYEMGQVQNYTPEQMKTYRNQFSHVAPDSYLSRLAGGDQSMFEEIEAPAQRQFQQQIGGIANRFSNAGMGSRRSSGFQNTTNQAAADFTTNLQAQRMSLRNQALQELMGYSNQLLGQRPYDRFMQEKPQKEKTDWWGLGGAALGGVGGFLTGGPAGALAGASLGYGIGSGKGSQGSSLSGFIPTSWGNNSLSGLGSQGGGSYSSYGSPGYGGISSQSNIDPSMFY